MKCFIVKKNDIWKKKFMKIKCLEYSVILWLIVNIILMIIIIFCYIGNMFFIIFIL